MYRLLQRQFDVPVALEAAWRFLALVEEWPRGASHIRRVEVIRHSITGVFFFWSALFAPHPLIVEHLGGVQWPSRAAESDPVGQLPVTTEPIALDTPTGKLMGTLVLPKSSNPVPVAVIIGGSGPTDRNGNSRVIPGANNSLKYLAEGLAAKGIASVRYDKRGVAESLNSAPSETDLRLETYIDDAVLWGKQLRKDHRFSALLVIGHSEGALIGVIASRIVGANAFISIAGVGRSAGEVTLDQLKGKLPQDLQSQAEVIVKCLSEGKTMDSVPPILYPLFRPSVQPYVISMFRYDPAKELARLSIPVLIVQGTTDIQVGVQEAKVLSRAKPSASVLIIEGMNHVLKEVPLDQEKQMKAYGDSSLPVVPRLIEGISRFIKTML